MNRLAVSVTLGALLFAFAPQTSASPSESERVITDTIISTDTTWSFSESIRIDGVVQVRPGSTLLIAAGSTIRVTRTGGLTVGGNLIVGSLEGKQVELLWDTSQAIRALTGSVIAISNTQVTGPASGGFINATSSNGGASVRIQDSQFSNFRTIIEGSVSQADVQRNLFVNLVEFPGFTWNRASVMRDNGFLDLTRFVWRNFWTWATVENNVFENPSRDLAVSSERHADTGNLVRNNSFRTPLRLTIAAGPTDFAGNYWGGLNEAQLRQTAKIVDVTTNIEFPPLKIQPILSAEPRVSIADRLLRQYEEARRLEEAAAAAATAAAAEAARAKAEADFRRWLNVFRAEIEDAEQAYPKSRRLFVTARASLKSLEEQLAQRPSPEQISARLEPSLYAARRALDLRISVAEAEGTKRAAVICMRGKQQRVFYVASKKCPSSWTRVRL